LPFALGAAPPAGSRVNLKSRFFRYSLSCVMALPVLPEDFRLREVAVDPAVRFVANVLS
jgi:hypothetical protein